MGSYATSFFMGPAQQLLCHPDNRKSGTVLFTLIVRKNRVLMDYWSINKSYAWCIKFGFCIIRRFRIKKITFTGMPLRFLFALLLTSFIHTLQAQELPAVFQMPLEGVDAYNSGIPTPMDVFGHQIGERHTIPHQLVDYFEAVDEASNRVLLNVHAYSYEGRPLIHAIVTSPENHARLDELRQRHLQLSESPNEISDADIEDMPIVVYQGYSIHGNEASGAEAALLYLYHLAAAEGDAIENALENAIIIVDPMFNPDGRDRFTDWVNRNRGGVYTTDPQDREHLEPWPGGRTNHYWFDLNRDWLPAQHPESQGRLDVFHTWRPQILTDHHEMGSNSSFFFMPGIPSRNNPLTPERNFELTAALASYHAEGLDEIGSLYYSKESFDDFYYGKGSTYPDVNGAIGILFEQGSSRALAREVNNGELHYGVTVQNQFATSLSTLKGAIELKNEFLEYYRDFYASSRDIARTSQNKAFVVSLERDRTRAQALAQMLLRHRVKMYDLDRAYESDGVTYRPGESYIVPVNQQQARLVKAAFETMTSFPDSLFYDVSTWTMPLAFDVDYAEIQNNPSGLLGESLDMMAFDGGERIGGQSEYGYVMEWDRYFAPRALHKVQRAGIHPRVLHKDTQVQVGGALASLARGSIVIPVTPRDRTAQVTKEQIETLVDQIVKEDHVRVFAVESGFAQSGVDLGSPSSTVLKEPKIALLTGAGTSAYNAGEVWHLLTERYRIPISLVDVDQVAAFDLSTYTTIIMAGGSYSTLNALQIAQWVQEGGHLITTSSGTNWAVQNQLFLLEEKAFDMDSLLSNYPFDQLDEARGAQVIGGAIFKAELDNTHPLGYGFREEVPLFRNSTSFYTAPDTPGLVVARYADDPLLSGYISEERLAEMPGSVALIAQRSGNGRIVSFMDNPNFRAFWYGSSRLFMNAVFFSGAF